MFDLTDPLKGIAAEIDAGRRITPDEALALAEQAPLALLGLLAVRVKERKSGKEVYYNRNFHIEPTNVCVFNCRFCSYRRPAGSPEAWDYDERKILSQVEAHRDSGATEVHIVGGVHPRNDLYYYADLIRKIKRIMPQASVKAFTAIELAYMIRQAGLAPRDGLLLLKQSGMEAIPGGGAEIFAEPIRSRICPEKGTADEWLSIHLDRLRSLQDETGGFNAFIPLKYRSRNNSMSGIGEVSVVEDMRMTALARIYLDNFPHIKAYWPMFGKTTAQIALAFGADDMDGTIDDSTKIYSMAGAEDQSPTMTTAEMERTIRSAGYEPVERDTFYRPVRRTTD